MNSAFDICDWVTPVATVSANVSGGTEMTALVDQHAALECGFNDQGRMKVFEVRLIRRQ